MREFREREKKNEQNVFESLKVFFDKFNDLLLMNPFCSHSVSAAWKKKKPGNPSLKLLTKNIYFRFPYCCNFMSISQNEWIPICIQIMGNFMSSRDSRGSSHVALVS